MSERSIDIIKFELINYDIQIARQRIRLVDRLEHIKNFLKTLFTDLNILEEVFFEILLIKLLDDRNFIRIQTSTTININEFFDCLKFINKKYNNILSPYLFSLKEEDALIIIRELQKFDFSELEIGKENKKSSIRIDQELEQYLFGKRYSSKFLETKLIECLEINKNSNIFCNTLELELFSFLFFTNFYPQKISLNTSNHTLVRCLCYGLFYNLIDKNDIVTKIINNNSQINLSEQNILIIKDESYLENIYLETNENIKILIQDIKNHFLTNQVLKTILNNYGVIFNIDYHTLENDGSIIRKNGLLVQRFFNHRSSLLSVFDKVKLRTMEEKKASNPLKNTISLTINYIKSITNSDPFYYGGLKREDDQIKSIEPIKIPNLEKQFLLEKNYIEEIDNIFHYAKYDEFKEIVNNSNYYNSFIAFDLQNRNFYSGSFEINTPTKQEIFLSNVLNPFFFRQEFINRIQEIKKQDFIILSDLIILSFFGKEYNTNIFYNDDLFIDKTNYIPIINEEEVRFGNFIDITKTVFIKKNISDLKQYEFIKENDILIAFKKSGEKVSLAWSIAPNILQGALPGKNVMVLRLDSISITPYEFVEYLNHLNINIILSRLTELISSSYLDSNLENICSNFILSFFESIPFIKNLSKCYESTSWLKQKICDLYFDLTKYENKYLKELFDNILNKNIKSSPYICFPSIDIWQYCYLELLWDYNKKPEKIVIISDYRTDEHRNILTDYLSTIEIVINNTIQKNSELKKVIKNFIENKIEIYTDKITSVNIASKIFVLFCDTAEMLKYHYDTKNILKNVKSLYLVYSNNQNSEEIFDKNYSNILNFIQENKIDIKERAKLDDIKYSFKNPFHLDRKFLSSLFYFEEIKINKNNRYYFFSKISNLFKEYADNIISHHKYYDQSAFFFLESNHFANKAMEIKIEENRDLAKKAEWELLIDQLAHSLNTNIGAAKNSVSMIDTIFKRKQDLNKYIDNTDKFDKYLQDKLIYKYLEKSSNYLTEVSDLIELILSNIRDIGKNIGYINLSEIIHEQILLIHDGIDTLRFSNLTHKNNVKNLKPILELDNTITIETSRGIATLIIKDLLKNAFVNTDHNRPYVKIKTMMVNDENCLLQIENNKGISEEWEKLINDNIEDEIIKMSKSQHLGIKVILRCKERLNWEIKVSPDRVNNFTLTNIYIPIKWKGLKF